MCVQCIEQQHIEKREQKPAHTHAREHDKNKTVRLTNRCTNIKSLPDIFPHFSIFPTKKSSGPRNLFMAYTWKYFAHPIWLSHMVYGAHSLSAHINKIAIGLLRPERRKENEREKTEVPIEIHWIVWIFAYSKFGAQFILAWILGEMKSIWFCSHPTFYDIWILHASIGSISRAYWFFDMSGLPYWHDLYHTHSFTFCKLYLHHIHSHPCDEHRFRTHPEYSSFNIKEIESMNKLQIVILYTHHMCSSLCVRFEWSN